MGFCICLLQVPIDPFPNPRGPDVGAQVDSSRFPLTSFTFPDPQPALVPPGGGGAVATAGGAHAAVLPEEDALLSPGCGWMALFA